MQWGIYILLLIYSILPVLLPDVFTKGYAVLERTFAKPLYAYRLTTNPIGASKPLPPSDDYTIVLVGDSMTDYLGPYAPQLGKHLKERYPNKAFYIFNYGFGATNVLSVQTRLEQDNQYRDQTFAPILKQDFDLILIESFGNNPLSQFKLEEGLKKQEEALGQAIASIKKERPEAKIAFLATVAPVRSRYGEGVVNLETEQRRKWADERIAYMKNHIKYAQAHNIPLINLYQESVGDGEGNIDLINTSDFIHPSVTGIDFISKRVADHIFRYRLIPL